MNSNFKKYSYLGLIAGSVLLLDQFTKMLVLKFWPEHGFVYQEVIPGFFSLVHFQNKGAAWGIFAGHTWLLGLFSALAALCIIFFWKKLTLENRFVEVCYAALWGGIVGNMIDRFWRPGVVDFLLFYIGKYSWPAFNVADSAITCSIVALVLYSLFFQKKPIANDGHTK